MSTTEVADPIRAAIDAWRSSLVNLTGRNRLLNFKPSKLGSIDIESPDAVQVLDAVRSSVQLRFRSLKPAEDVVSSQDLQTIPVETHRSATRGERGVVLEINKEQADLASALRSLMRRSTSEYLDRGVWILYLAFGFLSWTDVDESKYRSPLLLVPVRLVSPGPKQPPYLELTEEDPQFNPALTMKLGHLEVPLHLVEDLDEVSLVELFGGVREAVRDEKGWAVDESVTLSYFSFAKEAMYRDLLDHEKQIAEHPLVKALASGAGEGRDFTFDDLPAERLDQEAAPETTPLVLDADSSQRAAVAAALQGRSFVLDGPPGTGKSQTIANMIGALLHAGKTVLFVSEKAAALDVVKKRLTAVGLESYLLELHSHKATRREVATALGNALNSRPIPPKGMSSLDVNQAKRRREELNTYADAMNEPRDPLGYSLHHVLGLLSALHDVPAAPFTGIPASGLTVERLGEIREHAAAIRRAWRPAAQGRNFVWRGVAVRRRLDAELFEAGSALEALRSVTQSVGSLMSAFGFTHPSDATAAATLLSLFGSGNNAPQRWLTVNSVSAIVESRAQLADDLDQVHRAEEGLRSSAGEGWTQVPLRPPLDLAIPPATLPPIAIGELTADEARRVAVAFDQARSALQRDAESLGRIASALSVRVPATMQEAGALLRLGDLAREPDRADRRWLTESGHAAAETAVPVMLASAETLREAEAAGQARLTDDAVSSDLSNLLFRFENVHRGFAKFRSSYRADRTLARGLLKDPADRDIVGALRTGTTWRAALDDWTTTSTRHGTALGAYFLGRDTDFARTARGLEHAATARSIVGGQDLSGAADQLSADVEPDQALLASLSAARAGLGVWRRFLSEEPSVGSTPELGLARFSDAVAWLDDHRVALHAAALEAREYESAVGSDPSLQAIRNIALARRALEDQRQSVQVNTDEYEEIFGAIYRGLDTDVSEIDEALSWTRAVRQHGRDTEQALTDEQLDALKGARGSSALAEVASRWAAAAAALVTAFDTDRSGDIRDDLDDWTDARELIEELEQDSSGQEEWFTYVDARQELAAHGLDRAVDFCVRESVESTVVPDVLERALLQEWADEQLRSDSAFAVSRALDRDALVAEYRELDRALIGSATNAILTACNARRPRTSVGEAATIQTEAGKKRKHMPVRTLISRTRTVTQAIKPCFMMSPLAVSQYLEPDMHFDVVIFDEASQVAPGDAINCIYRGSALITAGDKQQLPPTNFFGGGGGGGGGSDEEEWSEDETLSAGSDFESVLDLAKGSGAFNSLTLHWHYRSRHESLIAFSNASFYDGRLITFPSSVESSNDSGVELIKVDGQYRRGSSRDNPVEAAEVAARVIHHFDTRPTMTLGVVAFSEAQAAAIEVAVDSARLERPDLDRFFNDDRLDGFFVKNLESVQGDERDVMIFSIGYGPDENGKVTMNFGPLNRDGGYRRLNVAVTRARYRNEIVSSIDASDITEGSRAEGLRHFRRYLDYAARGTQALALDAESGGDAESPFEESVISVIRSWGYDVTPQVGTAGYRVDIGVRHPDKSGVFVLGVECDGFQYHSSKVARDRDRLREDVLKGLGWTLHRIWGTAWYRSRGAEEQRLRAAIEHAVGLPTSGLLTHHDQAAPLTERDLEFEVVDFSQAPEWLIEYAPARLMRLPAWIDVGDYANRWHVIDPVERIVEVEAPVHISLVHQRLRDAWGIGRVGSRIRTTIDAAIEQSKRTARRGDFLIDKQSSSLMVRAPSADVSRTIEQVHDDEIGAAMVHLVEDAGGVESDALMVAVARMFGWGRRGGDIADRLERALDSLVRRSILARGDGIVRIGAERAEFAPYPKRA